MVSLSSLRIRDSFSIIVSQQIESNNPRSRKSIWGSSDLGGFCVFSKI